MKKYWLFLLLLMLVKGISAQELVQIDKSVVQPGEVLTYKISYGFLNVGEAKIETSSSVHVLENTSCYKVDISGKTTGAVGWVAKVDDKWGSYLNTQSLLPVKNYRIIRENNYKRDEVTYFDYNKKSIRYLRYDHKVSKFKDPQIFTFTNTVRDLIGGYHYLRKIDYRKLAVGDTIHLSGFFEDEFYEFKILYKGKEKVKTQFGKIVALKLVPVMPNNKVFDGENSITLWISDDDNRIPLKAEANMFIGKAACEITNYENLRSNLVIAGK